MDIAMIKSQNQFKFLLIVLVLLGLLGSVAAAQQPVETKKLAQTGMKFLQVGSSGRQTAMADAFTAAEGYSASMFYNPAGMARLNSNVDLSFGQTKWIADIKHLYGSMAYNLGDLGVFGFSAQYVDYGDIEQTILVDKSVSSQGFIDIGTFKPWAAALGVGYARALSDKFSVGGNVKWVKQDLGDSFVEVTSLIKDVTQADSVKVQKNAQSVLAFDFGVMYKTGFKSLVFGMAVRNFSKEVTYQKESFQLPLTFKMGLSMNMLDMAEIDPASQSLLLVVDAEHPRDYPEQMRIGAEYLFAQMVALRIGYVSPSDEHNLSYGLGLQQAWFGTQLAVDYSYTPFGVFDAVQRISLRFGF